MSGWPFWDFLARQFDEYSVEWVQTGRDVSHSNQGGVMGEGDSTHMIIDSFHKPQWGQTYDQTDSANQASFVSVVFSQHDPPPTHPSVARALKVNTSLTTLTFTATVPLLTSDNPKVVFVFTGTACWPCLVAMETGTRRSRSREWPEGTTELCSSACWTGPLLTARTEIRPTLFTWPVSGHHHHHHLIIIIIIITIYTDILFE